MIADQLPPEIAAQLHPARRQNEADYWVVRDLLMDEYRDTWIGFADGTVIASGRVAVEVFHTAEESGRHPFFICVGHEEEPCRIRRISFPYDSVYPGAALPVIDVEFRSAAAGFGIVFDRVIVDTGADASVLPWADCRLLQLSPLQGAQSAIGGVAGSSSATLAFQIWANLDGCLHPCRLQADFIGHERILGRDALNRLDVLFRGPAGEVVINP